MSVSDSETVGNSGGFLICFLVSDFPVFLFVSNKVAFYKKVI